MANPRKMKDKGGKGLFVQAKTKKRYAGTKVFLGYYHKRFVVVMSQEQEGELFANEYFKTKAEALSFTKENDFNVISENVIEWDRKTYTFFWSRKPLFEIPTLH
jgi:hypothetical protein